MVRFTVSLQIGPSTDSQVRQYLDTAQISADNKNRNVSIIAYWHRFFPRSWALLYPNTLKFQDAIPAATGTASFYIYNHKQEAEQ